MSATNTSPSSVATFARAATAATRPCTDTHLSGSLSLAWLLAPTLLLLLAVAAFCALTGREAIEFTRDPAAYHLTHPFVGAISNIGVLFWTATAAITLFAATVPARTAQPNLSPSTLHHEHRSLLLHVGLLSAWLMVDDLYMFHERIAPDDIGLPQPILFSGYALWLAVILAAHRQLVARSHYGLLVFALACFATSAALDQLAPGHWFEWRYMMLIEDGAKLLGIVGWFAYFAPLASTALTRR